MKKLIMTVLATVSLVAVGMTKEEALASKNFDVIYRYCSSNKIDSVTFIRDNVSYEDYKVIYATLSPESNYKFVYKYSLVNKYGKESLTGLVCNYDIRYMQLMMNKHSNVVISAARYSSISLQYTCIKNMLIEDAKNGPDYVLSAKFAKLFYTPKKDTVLIDILKPRVKTVNAYAYLICSVITKDIDGIIDALVKCPSDVDADIASDIIPLLNSLDVNYRKDEMIHGLQNLNSICTIKLYDDQKTWEPILAKIRAMISVRK